MPDTTLTEDLAHLAELKARYRDLDKQAKDASRDMKSWEYRCFERMKEEGVKGHRDHDHLFTPVAKDYAQVQDLDAFITWAREHEPELLKTVGREKELNALVRARLDDNEPMPPGLGWYVREYISVKSS